MALPRDGKGRILSRKKNKVVGRLNALENLTAEQKRLIGLCRRKELTTEECINLTKFNRATIYKLRKNIFPDSINNKEISTNDCIRLTGYSKTYLYKLLEKNNI